MRWILRVAVLGAILWTGIWFVGVELLRKGAAQWMAQNHIGGDLTISGFPSRLNFALGDLAIDSDALTYQAPNLKVSTNAWWPWRYDADLGQKHNFRIANQPITVTSQPLMASVTMDPLGVLPLGRVALSSADLAGLEVAITSALGWALSAQVVTLKLDATSEPISPNVRARVTSIAPPLVVPDLPALIDVLSLDVVLRLKEPMDVTQLPTPVFGVDIQNARLDWGTFRAEAQGQIAPDAMGRLSGEVFITLQGAQHLPKILQRLGIITSDQSSSLAQGLSILGPEGQLSLPMTMTGGMMRIGPLPLGVAPNWPL